MDSVTETLERARTRRAPWAEPAVRVAERARRLTVLPFLGGTAVLAGVAILAIRVMGDIRGKPLFEDEAVAGLVAARPFTEVLETVWWERGGAPLHFVLSHLALLPDGSPYALRWLSLAFAIATVPLAWDIGRRLGGHVAGGASAFVVSASSMLWVYGSFGRMYSLYVFAAALAVDLFIRAVRERTGAAAFAAALAAWLVPAVHPYGIFLVGAEALVGLALWRGRPLRSALPVVLVGVALIPFLVADFRLAERFSVGLEGEASVAPAGAGWAQLGRAFQATAGGEGWTLALAALLAAAGLAELVRRRARPVVALFLLSAAIPPVLLFLARTNSAPGLSPRHLAYLVPVFAALVGVGLARLVRGRSAWVGAAALAALGAVLVVSPLGGIQDARGWSNDVLGGGPAATAVGSPRQLAPAKAWLEANVGERAVVFPYSAVYLAALSVTRDADALPYAQRQTVIRALDRVDPPVPELFVSVPIGISTLDVPRLEGLLGPEFVPHRFGRWLLIRGRGPYPDDHAVLLAVYEALAAARESTVGFQRNELGWYYATTLSVLCGSLRTFGESCPPPSIAWLRSSLDGTRLRMKP
jgi:hypothetical protein